MVSRIRLGVATVALCALCALLSAERYTRVSHRQLTNGPAQRRPTAPSRQDSVTLSLRTSVPAPSSAPLATKPAEVQHDSTQSPCPSCASTDGRAPIDKFSPTRDSTPFLKAYHGAIGVAIRWQATRSGEYCSCRSPGSLDAPGLKHHAVLAWVKNASSARPARDTTTRCRTFVVSTTRRDLNESVRKAATRLGMCEWRGKGNWYDFELREPPAEEDTPQRFVRRKRTALSGYIPGLRDALGTKAALARLQEQCGCAFLPPSFEFKWSEDRASLQGPRTQLRELSLAQGDYPQLWVVKTHDGFSQHEMKLSRVDPANISSDDALERWLQSTIPTKAGMSCRDARIKCEKGRGTVRKTHLRWVLQTYVRRPARYLGRKFDLRVWVAITSLDPLRLVLLGQAFPKISTVAYDPSPEYRHDLCMHVRLPIGKGCDAADLVQPYPTTTLEPDFFRGLNFSTPLNPAEATEFWHEVIVPEVERTISLTVLYARLAPLKIHHQLLRAGAAHRRFAVLSLDVLLDEGGGVHIVDVNTNGNLQGDYSYPARGLNQPTCMPPTLASRVRQAMDRLFNTQRDISTLLPILGADGFPKRATYEGAAGALLARCCAHCDEAARQAAAETLDEEVHAYGSMWYHSFPALMTDAHEKLTTRLPTGLLTNADRALHAFLRCRRGLGHAELL